MHERDAAPGAGCGRAAETSDPAEVAEPRVNNTSKSPVGVGLDWWKYPRCASNANKGAGSKGAINRSCSSFFNDATVCMIFANGARPLRMSSLTSRVTICRLIEGC